MHNYSSAQEVGGVFYFHNGLYKNRKHSIFEGCIDFYTIVKLTGESNNWNWACIWFSLRVHFFQ